jgi:hypothetical protein
LEGSIFGNPKNPPIEFKIWFVRLLGCTKLSKRGFGRYDSYKCIIPNHNSINTGKLYNGALINPDVFDTSKFPGFSQSTDDKNRPVYSINFNDLGWSGTGLQGICSKRNWSKNYNIQWDGVSNYTNCPTSK